MKYLSILPLLLITVLLWGQGIDNKRMTRDIEVAENILDALLSENNSQFFRSYQVEGTYLDGYGVLFTIKNPFGGLAIAPQVAWSNDRIRSIGKGELRGYIQGQNEVYAFDQDSILSTSALDEEKFKTLSETFLADYGHLLTQLPDNERICIKYAAGNTMVMDLAVFEVAQNSGKSAMPGFTAVTPKQAVEDFRAGKIDRKGLVAKIEYSKTEAVNQETDRELILLNSIFNRLYQQDLSDGFFMRGQGRMEKIAGLGALFAYNFTTKGRYEFHFGDDLFNGYGLNYSNEEAKARVRAYAPKARALETTKEEEQAEGNAEEKQEQPDFEEFLENFKTNVLEYGSTVRNLKPEEVLSFELSLPSCKDCDDRPEKVKITAKQTLLEKYRQGKISLNDAVEQLQVTTY